MAGMKQLSAGSSQILMMMFRDKNNAPIKADSVHVKGSIFTGSGKPFEFEVNKGVCTNCKIQNDMLLFNIVPLLGLGQMQVYTQTYLGDTKAITGTYISENQQKLGVEVSRALVFDEPEIDVNNDVMYFGDNTYLSVKTAAKVSISNNQLVVKDNGKDLPVFSLFKKYSRFDTHVLKGKNYKATVKITDKQNSFVVALMKYTGTEAVAPSPELLSINNDQPQFNAGWSIADRLFISEDVVSGIHEATKTFVIPADAVEFAVIIYPTESQTPTNMVLNDFEGDITPWFNRMVVTDSSHISEKYLEYQKDYAKFVVMTPAGDASYRYTYNKTA